jgi:hypothetical protein
VNINVEGVFESGGSFGHMNAYSYQSESPHSRKSRVLSKGMKTHAEELEIQRQFACGGEKPR